MAEQLTKKYRPQYFREVVGQEAIKRVLSRAALEDRVAPAYLFSGTRGVGKTTLARILAKAINCKEAPTAEPCNQCLNCKSITKGNFPDVLEIDGASHTGVDHVRKLREDVFLPPLHSRYKVIIIDEAHMLSKSAFNALLKTLEEPPKHCVFIFATTEPEKFPITIISRCQHYVFKSLSQKDISEHLKKILKQEKVDFEEKAVELIARRGNGAIRDAMSLLGQVLVFSENKLLAQEVQLLLGLAGEELFIRIFEIIYKEDLEAIHKLVEEVRAQGLDLSFFLQEFGYYWRNLFILSQLKERAKSILELEENKFNLWLKIALTLGEERIHLSWQMLLEEQKNILKSVDPMLSLEMFLFNLAYLPKLVPVSKVKLEEDKKKEVNFNITNINNNVHASNTLPNQLKSEPQNINKANLSRDEIKSHPLVQKVLEEFNARIVEIKKNNKGRMNK